MDKFINQILHCDCVASMKKLPDGSVDLGLTSPPFDDLRHYGGQPFTDEIFREVARELYRIIQQGGILCWDVQDRTKHGNRTGTSFRQVLHFQEIGFQWHDTIFIVSNVGRLPCKGHYPNVVRHCFIFAKGKRPEKAEENNMKSIFTKTFFGLSAIDKALIVDAALQDQNQHWASKEDELRAKRKRQRIEKKAIEYGVWEEVK